jgi:zinc/manganese transport system ATP-binding protein
VTDLNRQPQTVASVAARLRTVTAPIARASRASAAALCTLGRATFARAFDAGYDPVGVGAEPSRSRAIEVRDLSVRYRGRPALANLMGSFAAGSLTAVAGPNGAGKSTLLKALAGIVRVRRGAVVGVGQRRRLAYLPQQATLDRSFPITVAEFAALGGWRHFGAFRSPPREIAERTAEAIAAVGLDGLAGRRIGELSVGQFQRALFARLLVQDATVLLLDEPFAAIDERTADDLLQVLRRWHADGRTIIAVLHDLAQVRTHFPLTLLLARRAIAWGETGAVLTPENLAQARAALEEPAGALLDEAA